MRYHFQPGMKWKKDVLVLSLSGLNTNDFQEYLKPIRTRQIKVPDAEHTFPMSQRDLCVQAGLATDALERPITQALEHQDAAPVDEAGDTGGVAEAPKEPKKVIHPRTGKMVEVPEGGSYYDSGGTLGRRYDGSKKLIGIPTTYLWSTMSKAAKDKATREEAAEVAGRLIEEERGAEASSSSRRPAGVADNLKDHCERQGNQWVRYHCTPRKEMFSPDSTDCPVNSNMLSSTRTTHILPMGSQHITTDVDDWSVKRRRNRNRKFSFQWIGKTVLELKPASTRIRSDDLDTLPCMPTAPHSPQHRDKELA